VNIFRTNEYPATGLVHQQWVVLIPLLAVIIACIHLFPLLTAAVAGLALFSWLAIRSPVVTVGLLLFAGQIIQHELAPLLGLDPEGIQLQSIRLRLSDPILAGMSVALAHSILTRKHGLRVGKGLLFSFSVFAAWLVFEIVRHAADYGINSAGEFRTYYHWVITVPYIILLMPGERGRRVLFRVILFLSFSHLFWALLRGGVMFGFSIGYYDKWLSSFGSLSLLLGVFAVILSYAHGERRGGIVPLLLLVAASAAAIVIAGARSVWIAALVSGALFFRSRLLRPRLSGFLIGMFLLASGLLFFLFSFSDMPLAGFLRERALAVTDFQLDPTSSWRYYFWISALEGIALRPWFGSGFGMHFNIFVPELNEAFTTSPHNLYLTLVYQTGLIGFLLYCFPLVSLFRVLQRAASTAARLNLPALLACVALVSLHVYGLAFSFEKEFISWAFVGLGASAALRSPEAGEEQQND